MSLDLLARIAFIEEEVEQACRLQAADRWAHLVVVDAIGCPPAVASSWPDPPPYRRRMVDVDTRGRT